MGSIVQRLKSLATTANSSLAPHLKSAQTQITTQYGKLLEDNAQYVVKDKAAADKLLKQLVFTNLARYGYGVLALER